jgi:hypothetical protein
MTRKLSDADREAVDLMFDRITSAQGGNGDGGNDAERGDGFVAIASGVNSERLQSVEEILGVLAMMPAAEPPADLAVRTLQHIARRSGVSPMPAAAAATFIDPSQPHA